uniref:Uncharacterized protein n=1 Tax=Aliivibrio wodanis TaxID=80852 RepID=A0A5Q4Z484_9GAMM|nr:hypothetical protein AW0309160_01258 [Aliivibrio wodanis]
MEILTLLFGSVLLVMTIGFFWSFCKALIIEFKKLD